MLMWGGAIGALLGWILSDFETFGAGLGAIAGLLAMRWLRSELRAEIRTLLADEQAALLEDVNQRIERAFADTRTAADRKAPAPSASVAIEPAEPIEPVMPARPMPWAQAEPVASTAAAPVPELPAEPAPPTLIDDAVAAVRGWLFGGNTIVRLGLVILFVGLAFLARYAAMAGLFPIELRLSLVAAAGLALLVTGFLKREARPDFALALQGGGVAVLYLTIFGAARFFELLPLLPAFGLMLLVCALGCALALLQNARLMALASFIGGFAVPLLLGGEGSSVGLFGYYAVLNIAVLALVWRKGWRLLGPIGFVATFGVMGAWVATSYTPADYPSAQAFLILFVLIYLALALLAARSRHGAFGAVVDSTLLFGPALAGLGIQIALVRHLEFGAAFSALGFAALYLLVAALLRKRGGAVYAIFVDGLLAIGVGALTLAVPLALGASWTSSVWAIEGAAAVWIGARQARLLPRLFGLALIGVATLLFLSTIGDNVSGVALVGRNTLGAVLVAVPLLLVAWWLRKPLLQGEVDGLVELQVIIEKLLAAPLFIAGFLMSCLAIGLEATRLLPPQLGGEALVPAVPVAVQGLLVLLGVLLLAGASLWLGRRHDWPVAVWPSRLTLPLIAASFLARVIEGHFLLDWPDWLAWFAALALHGVYLYRNDRAEAGPIGKLVQRAAHVGGVWLLVAMLANALWYGVDRGDLWQSDWASVAFLISAIAVLVLLTLWAGRGNRQDRLADLRWPLNPHAIAYWWQAALPVAALVWLGALALAFTANGTADPLPYLPLLNPVDLSLALALGALLLWRRCLSTAEPQPRLAGLLAGPAGLLSLVLLAFLIVNSLWLRIAHHYLDVPWSASAMTTDASVQAGLAILWTLLALGLMLLAHRRVQRQLWLGGAGLLGAVVLKLLLIDMSSAAGGQRIIAFIGVGVLMLVVGYFVPLPPKPAEAEEPA